MGQKTEKIFERGKVNLENNNHEQALRLFNQVLNREPKHQKALRSKALIKVLKENEEEAESFLLEALKLQPKDDHLHQILGSLYHNRDAPHKALSQFKKALDLNSSNTLAHQGLGMLYAHFYDEHNKAVTHFTKAIESNGSSADLFFNRGCSFMILRRMEAAKKDLEKATELNHVKAEGMLDNYFR